jgi:phosphate starvation-inducible PhoH-like protein
LPGVVASSPTEYASNTSTLSHTHSRSQFISDFVAGRKRARPHLKQIELPPRGLETLFGVHDQNIKYLESLLAVRIDARGQDVSIDGEPDDVATAERILEDFSELFREGRSFTDKELREAFAQIAEDRAFSLRDYFTKARFNPAGKKQVAPKSATQRKYIQAIQEQDVVFGIGVAGTGKTYLAVALAVQALMQKQVNRIVLARPAVEAGEKLGFLPGDLQEKVDPYLRPLYDALFDLIDYERVTKLLEKQVIEVAPLAFMRGRTLSDAFIILDEAQNTTSEQMKMFLTRIGFGSKAVITGDVTQVDLPAGKRSGLIEAERVLANLNGIEFIYFTEKDVVRHKLVQMIIKAYEEHSHKKSQI